MQSCDGESHNRLVDVKVQTDALLHPWFILYIDQPFSVHEITEIFSKTQQNAWKKEMETVCAVHAPWVEITKGKNVT